MTLFKILRFVHFKIVGNNSLKKYCFKDICICFMIFPQIFSIFIDFSKDQVPLPSSQAHVYLLNNSWNWLKISMKANIQIEITIILTVCLNPFFYHYLQNIIWHWILRTKNHRFGKKMSVLAMLFKPLHHAHCTYYRRRVGDPFLLFGSKVGGREFQIFEERGLCLNWYWGSSFILQRHTQMQKQKFKTNVCK